MRLQFGRFTAIASLVVFLSAGGFARGQVITEIIDSAGDGGGNGLAAPFDIAVDASGNVYVTGRSSDNAFKITPGGVITQIIDASGDGGGNALDRPEGIAVDGSGNAYVTGALSDNAFRITPGGVITEIIDASGDGIGNALDVPRGIAVDGSGNAYVTGGGSDNAFKISPGGLITEIIDASGDGSGHSLGFSGGVAVDASGNVYVTGNTSDNAFKISPGGLITEIIDASGDGSGSPLDGPSAVAVDASGNVYVSGNNSDNAFQVTPGGMITEIIDAAGDGAGNALGGAFGIAVDGSGNVYVGGDVTHNAFQITPGGEITQIINASGDASGNVLDTPRGIAVDISGSVYVTGESSNNAFRIAPPRLYVDASAIGADDGTSWPDAYTNLQDALTDATGSGGTVTEIWVAAGTYTPDLQSCTVLADCSNGNGASGCDGGLCTWLAPRGRTFQLINGVALYGGFAGGETSLDQRDIAANETILSGDLLGNDLDHACPGGDADCASNGGLCVDGVCIIADNNAENSYHVVTGSGADATAVLDGFTVTSGNANGTSPEDRGGGMYNDVGSPTVTNCTFSRNTTPFLGGGMYNQSNSSPTVTDCTFDGNEAANAGGGGMFNSESNPTVTDSTFARNSTNFDGGAMFNSSNSSPTVTGCTFSGNSVGRDGGAIYNNASSPTVTNCTFLGNSSDWGGGMHNAINSNPTVTNCAFNGNTAADVGGGMFNNSGSSPTVTNCTFSGNSSAGGAGGMYNQSESSPTVTNCTFSANSAMLHGGGMSNAIDSNPTVTNCTFNGNSANGDGGGIYIFDGSTGVTNSVLWGNVDDADASVGGPFADESAQIHTASGTPTVDYSIVQGGWTGAGGTGNSASDPLFVDADGADDIAGTEDDDLRLRPTSPAIDAGDNTALPADTADLDGDLDTAEEIPFDLDGLARRTDDPTTVDFGNGTAPIVDMGAYEFVVEVTFEWVTVGNPGNAADPFNSGTIPGIGSVGYEYRIARHEVTNAQYAVFLNAVAETDTNSLYNASMGSNPHGGITQSGSSGSFTYAIKTDMSNKPVNYVSFFDAMRFVNWLHNGQPTGAQGAGTTENGVYSISDGLSETRAGGAQFFIPTENEWFKAAYHQPSGDEGDSDDYWLFPTASNTAPTVATANATGDISNPGANVVNYDQSADWNGQDGNVTTVGSAGPQSDSYYGTSDQGGNVSEWNEEVSGVQRVHRGGSWFYPVGQLQSSGQSDNFPTAEFQDIGFRVASPVPQTAIRFVDSGASGLKDGTSWIDAYVNLQDALADAAGSGGDVTEIWVAAGTYTPDLQSCTVLADCANGNGASGCDGGLCTWLAPRGRTFQLINGVALYGGFAGGETSLDERDIAANETILSGDLFGNDADHACPGGDADCASNGGLCVDGVCIIADNNAENSYHVVTGSGTDGTAILEGFKITGGNADGTSPDNRGAGIYNDNGSPTIQDCVFRRHASIDGGAMFNTGASPVVTRCTFSANYSFNAGGGMHNLSNSQPTVTGCTFENNLAANANGGGMHNNLGSNPTVTGCTFTANGAPNGNGGGMYTDTSSPTVADCIFSLNWANGGGAMVNTAGSNPSITSCRFADNTAIVGGGMRNSVSNPVITNCYFNGNTADTGGAIYNTASSCALTNCALSGNASTGGGGGAVYNDNGSSPSLVACTLSANEATTSTGGGVHNSATGINSPIVANCVLWANSDIGGTDESAQIHTDSGTPTVNYSIVMGGWTGAGGMGNSTSDPLFVDADGADNIAGTEDDDLRLRSGSPAIDSGDNTAVPADIADLDGDLDTGEPTPLDLDGNDRFVDDPRTTDGGNGTPPIVDMGAYEFQPPIFVDASASGANDGTSWNDAFASLQEALTNIPGTPREVWVAKGTYMPDGGYVPDGGGHVLGTGLRTATFQLSNGISIYGGFTGVETSRSDRNSAVNETILSGDLDGDDADHACPGGDSDCASNGGLCGGDGFCIIADNNAENSYHVVTGSGTDATAILDGFTITSGNANGSSPDDHGAGVNNETGSPTLRNCNLTGNSATTVGGGMHNNSNSSPIVTDCTFTGNSADSTGGGMYNIFSSSPTVTNCKFSGNSAVSNGGGMFNSFSSPTVTYCTFRDNSANGNAGGGGGMYNSISSPTVTDCAFIGNSASNDFGGGMVNGSDSSPVVTNCTFNGNSAASFGGGMHNTSNGNPALSNCTFSDNSAGGDGGGMFNLFSSPTVTNCILWRNSDAGGMDESAQIHTSSGTPVVNYSIVQGGWTGAGGTGNSSGDPLFVDADGPDNIVGTEDDDVRLTGSSPAIDAGDTTALPLDTLDLDGDGDTAEWISVDLAGNPRVIDDLQTTDTGVAGSPVVDMGAYEFVRDCNGNGLADSEEVPAGTSPDCDGNGIPDSCDIDDCPDATPSCNDCNFNGVPDSCDIAGVTSDDLNLDEVPDECRFPFTGGVNWSDPIWIPAANDYPDNDPGNPDGIPDQHVVLKDENLLLDVTVEIDTLTIENGASLCMNGGDPCAPLSSRNEDGSDEPPAPPAAADTGDLFLAQSNGLLVEGVLDIEANRLIGEPLEAEGAGLTISNDGDVKATDSTITLTGPVVIKSGGLYHDPNRAIDNTASLQGDSLTVIDERIDPSRQTEITLSGTMETNVTTISRVRGNSRPLELPPPRPASAQALFPPSVVFRALDSSSYTIGGDLILEEIFELRIGTDGAVTREASVTIGGDFVNHGKNPSTFDWSDGILVLDGTAEQRFEVAGIDFGQSLEGFETDADTIFDTSAHTNFSMGRMEVGTAGDPATVRFVNEFTNSVVSGPCGEALYVVELRSHGASTIILENARVYYNVFEGAEEGVTITEIGCGKLLPVCFSARAPDLQAQWGGALAPEPKPRYIAVRAGDAGRMQSVRVTWDAMPNWAGGYTALVGQQMFLTQPFKVCENSSQGLAVSPPNCGPAPGLPQRWFWAASLTCDEAAAAFVDLEGLTEYCSGPGAEPCTSDADCLNGGTCGVDGVVHLYSGAIAPTRVSGGGVVAAATYSVQAVDESCSLSLQASYSAPLVTNAAGWGDLTGTVGSCPTSVPNNSADLVGDVTEAINKFSNNLCAPKKTRVDVDHDFQINFPSDVLILLSAFSAGGGGFSEVAPAACPAVAGSNE